jgi:hypothetical protein
VLDALDNLDDILSRAPSAKIDSIAQYEGDHDNIVSHPDEEDAEEAVTQQVGRKEKGRRKKLKNCIGWSRSSI